MSDVNLKFTSTNRIGGNVKNHIDMLIFHIYLCKHKYFDVRCEPEVHIDEKNGRR